MGQQLQLGLHVDEAPVLILERGAERRNLQGLFLPARYLSVVVAGFAMGTLGQGLDASRTAVETALSDYRDRALWDSTVLHRVLGRTIRSSFFTCARLNRGSLRSQSYWMGGSNPVDPEKRMKAVISTVVTLLGLLTLAPSHASASGIPTSQTAAAKTKEGAEKTKDVVIKGAKTVADTTKDGLSKSGDVMTDAWITTRIHERFVGEDLLKDSDISVDTSKHVVTLMGTVTRWAGRTKAEKIAKRTEGVYQVVNRLTVGSKRND
jgi:osmotically-inducible protein OsmY